MVPVIAAILLLLLLLLLRWFLTLLRLGLLVLAAIAGINLWMTGRCTGRIHPSAQTTPPAPAGLVLGTSQFLGPSLNSHFRVRMDAAAALYKAGKVQRLILSGDRTPPGYNEPEDMRRALAARGVPEAAMTCDYAGFRTLESVVRARDVFGLSRCTIISDDFHLARALWLADQAGLRAGACHGETVPWSHSWKTRAREWLARVLAVSDVLTGQIPAARREKAAKPAPGAPL